MDKFFTFFFNKKLCENTLSTFMFFSPYNGKSAILFLKKKIPKFQIHIQLLHKDKGTFWKMGTTPSALQAEECSILINLKFNIIPFRSPDHPGDRFGWTACVTQTVSNRVPNRMISYFTYCLENKNIIDVLAPHNIHNHIWLKYLLKPYLA